MGLFFLSLEHWFSESKAKQELVTNAICLKLKTGTTGKWRRTGFTQHFWVPGLAMNPFSFLLFKILNRNWFANTFQIHMHSTPNDGLWHEENKDFRQSSDFDGYIGNFKYLHPSQASSYNLLHVAEQIFLYH